MAQAKNFSEDLACILFKRKSQATKLTFPEGETHTSHKLVENCTSQKFVNSNATFASNEIVWGNMVVGPYLTR